MRRWLLSLLLSALCCGELALIVELLLVSLNTAAPELLFLLLRFTPAVVFVSAVSSLAVYWATLYNSITGPPFFLASRYWLGCNSVMYLTYAAALIHSGLRGDPFFLLLLMATTYAAALLCLAYYGQAILRVLPSVPAAGRRILNRLVPLVSISCGVCILAALYFAFDCMYASPAPW